MSSMTNSMARMVTVPFSACSRTVRNRKIAFRLPVRAVDSAAHQVGLGAIRWPCLPGWRICERGRGVNALESLTRNYSIVER